MVEVFQVTEIKVEEATLIREEVVVVIMVEEGLITGQLVKFVKELVT